MHHLVRITVALLLVAGICYVQGRCASGFGCKDLAIGNRATRFSNKRSDSGSSASSSASGSDSGASSSASDSSVDYDYEDMFSKPWWTSSFSVDQVEGGPSVNYTYITASFVVPRIPASVDYARSDLEFDLYMQTAASFQDVGGHFDFVGISLAATTPEKWSVNAYFCPSATCNVSEFVTVNEGDTLTFSIYAERDFWTGTVLSTANLNAPILTYSLPKSMFIYGSMKEAGLQTAAIALDDCTWLSSSNSLNFTDLVIMDKGFRVVYPKWMLSYNTNPCNLQAHTNGVSGWFSWTSESTLSNSYDTCAIALHQIPISQFSQVGKIYYQFEAWIENWSSKELLDITSLTFRFSDPAYQIWVLHDNGNSSYSLPSYVLPLAPKSVLQFGYIATKMLYPVNVQCMGGQRLLHQDVRSTEISEGDATSECAFRIDQEVVNSWINATGSTNVNINAVITNTGYRAITFLTFSADSASAISDWWSVSKLGNGNFGLPSWTPSLGVGASFSFGYIAQSTQPITFQPVEALCY